MSLHVLLCHGHGLNVFLKIYLYGCGCLKNIVIDITKEGMVSILSVLEIAQKIIRKYSRFFSYSWNITGNFEISKVHLENLKIHVKGFRTFAVFHGTRNHKEVFLCNLQS